MPTLNLKLDIATNLKLNELVLALTISDSSRESNRSHAARKAIIELHARLCVDQPSPAMIVDHFDKHFEAKKFQPRTLETDQQEDS